MQMDKEKGTTKEKQNVPNRNINGYMQQSVVGESPGFKSRAPNCGRVTLYRTSSLSLPQFSYPYNGDNGSDLPHTVVCGLKGIAACQCLEWGKGG